MRVAIKGTTPEADIGSVAVAGICTAISGNDVEVARSYCVVFLMLLWPGIYFSVCF